MSFVYMGSLYTSKASLFRRPNRAQEIILFYNVEQECVWYGVLIQLTIDLNNKNSKTFL
jgi:hypothetical protein